jgi:branched-chain amino acid transport system substrate-binding protein
MKHTRRRLLGLAIALSASLFLTACKNKESGGEGDGASAIGGGASSNEILVGEYSSLTGGTATFGIATNNGIKLALDEVNEAGGINGKKIRLITEDDQSKPEVAQTVVTKLVQRDKVVAVLGEVASTRSMRAAPVCQAGKVPMISPSSTNPKVTEIGDYIFRVCFTDDFQAAVAAQFAWDQGYKKVAIFKDIKNDYSVAFADFFKKKFTQLGGQVVGEQTYQEGDTDFKAQLNTLKSSNPEALLIPGYYTEVGTIARQARDVGLNVPLIGGDGWESPDLIPGAGKALEGCFFTNHYFSSDMTEGEVKAFIDRYKAKYNEAPSVLAALGYDAAKILVEAMKNAKTLDGTGIRDALAQVKDFPGTTGKITIDAKRNARKEAVVLQIQGNSFKVYRTYRPEQVGL